MTVRVTPVAATTMGFSRHIKRAMDEEDVTQEVLAEWAGLKRHQLNRILNGKEETTIGTWVYLAWLLNRRLEIHIERLPIRHSNEVA